MTAKDERPAAWVGHVILKATDLARSTEYWEKIGMRIIVTEDTVSVLELRGGIHVTENASSVRRLARIAGIARRASA